MLYGTLNTEFQHGILMELFNQKQYAHLVEHSFSIMNNMKDSVDHPHTTEYIDLYIKAYVYYLEGLRLQKLYEEALHFLQYSDPYFLTQIFPKASEETLFMYAIMVNESRGFIARDMNKDLIKD